MTDKANTDGKQLDLIVEGEDGSVEVKVDGVAKDDDAAPAAGQKEAAVNDADLDDLRKQLEAEKRARQSTEQRLSTAERERTEVQRTAKTAVEGQLQAQSDSIESMLKAAASDADRLESELVAANEAGRFKDAAALSRKLTSKQVEVENLTAAKDQIGRHIEKVKAAPDPAQVSAEEKALAPYSEASKAWIRQHPEFLSDQKFYNKVMAANYDAVAEGHAIDSAEYFDFIERRVGLKSDAGVVKNGADKRDDPPPSSGQERTRVNTGAPPSRSSNMNGNDRSSRAIRLSREEAEVALLTYPKLTKEEAYRLHAIEIQRAVDRGEITRH